MASSLDFSKKVFALITGASQGIGRTLAVELAKRLGNDSIILLLARSETGLIQTKNLILDVNKNVSVKIKSMDLTHPTIHEYEQLFDSKLKVDLAIIFHNVGQIGTLNVTTELTEIQNWRDYYDLNVFSVGILNSVFIKKMRDSATRLAVINITSLCGRQPFHSLAMYSTGKAAREMYFKIFALEEKSVIVLNYSPGPVDTPMIDEVLHNLKHDEGRDVFVQMKENKTILTPLQTVEKLLTILGTGDFESGAVIDYFDRI